MIIGLFIIGTFPSSSKACSCAELPSVGDEFARSEAVFSGKVIDVKESRGLKGSSSKSVLFEVTNTWKGVHKSQMIISTGLSSGDCGFDFSEGQEYLVYAHKSTMYGSKSLVTTTCDRTKELRSSKEDLKILGNGQSPTEEVNLNGSFGKNPIYIWIAVFIAIGIIVIFIFKRKKRVK